MGSGYGRYCAERARNAKWRLNHLSLTGFLIVLAIVIAVIYIMFSLFIMGLACYGLYFLVSKYINKKKKSNLFWIVYLLSCIVIVILLLRFFF